MKMIMRLRTRYSGSIWVNNWSSVSWKSKRTMSTINNHRRSAICNGMAQTETEFWFRPGISYCWKQKL